MKTKRIRATGDEPNSTRTTKANLESAMNSAVRITKVGATARETNPSFGPSFEPCNDLVFAVSRESEFADRFRYPRNPNPALKTPNFLPGFLSRAPDASARLPVWKRTLDLFIILLCSPLWLPLMILIMLAIKATSAGPVFYRQERVGYRGQRFMLFKFRTMKVNVDTRVHETHLEHLIATDCPMTKLDAQGDPRLIQCGRFLRAAALDELPQIFNVLLGEMSLVGARPCTVGEFEHYRPWQRERVNGPPGLTGYWQVNGKNKTTFSEMIEMDIFYAGKMSVRLDLAIMLRTIPAVISQVREARSLTQHNNASRGLARTLPLRGSAPRLPTRSEA